MNDSDFEFIESHLGVTLPILFKDFMRPFPGDASHQLQGPTGILQTNAELFVIAQLTRFRNDFGFDYYKLQPSLRANRFIDIGEDGCGNFYCMSGNDSDSTSLWFWDHESSDGFTLYNDAGLGDYLEEGWEIGTRENPFSQLTFGNRVITRADHPSRSIFSPISMQEWLAFVSRDEQLSLDEHRLMINPFTKEEVAARSWPGRAILTTASGSAHIAYTNGSLNLLLDEDEAVDPEFGEKIRAIAEALNANLF